MASVIVKNKIYHKNYIITFFTSLHTDVFINFSLICFISVDDF